MPDYNSNTKVTYELLDQDLQDKLSQYSQMESDNLEQANENKDLISHLNYGLSDKINRLQTLSNTILNKFNTESSNILSYNGTTTGIGQGLQYAKDYGLPGQLCKADYHYKNRAIPDNGLVVMRLCNISNQDTVLSRDPLDENDKYAYNYENKRVYYRTAATNNWVLYDPIDESKLLFLYNNFIYDPVSHKMWYSINPSKMIYLWESKDPYSNIRDTQITPRDQLNVEVIPKDIEEGDLDTIDYEMVVKNLIGVSAENARRPDQTYKSRILIGSGRYFKDYNLLRNNPYQYKFVSFCNGPAKVIVTMKWDMGIPPYPEESTLTRYLNLRKNLKSYTSGSIALTLDNEVKSLSIFRENFYRWERSIEFLVSNLSKGDHILKFEVDSDIMSHLFMNDLSLYITHI